jgi:hypothetical protein
VSRRLKADLYAGAVGRTNLRDAARLGRGFVVQPKVDGSYVTVRTDVGGRVSHLFTRNGHELPANLMRDFEGLVWAPESILIAEAEVWSEASNRVAARRGYRALHLFDALRVRGEDVSSLPQAARRDALMRAETWVIDHVPDLWERDEGRRARALSSGQFCAATPRSWRRMQVVPQLPAHLADKAWAEWVEPGREPIEGLVVVQPGARLGARKAKLKVKRLDTIDAIVLEAGDRIARLRWAGGTFVQPYFKAAELRVGQVVEVSCSGFYETSGEPKHSRIVRSRPDLQTGARQ